MMMARFTLILFATLTLSASTVVRVDVGQLSQMAISIVGGRVISITPEKNPDNGYIYSDVTLQVSHAIPPPPIWRGANISSAWSGAS